MIPPIPLKAPGETNQRKTEHCQTNMPQVGGEQTIENEETRNPPDIQHSECIGTFPWPFRAIQSLYYTPRETQLRSEDS